MTDLEGLIARLRDADRGSVQRSLGSRIFGEAADTLSQMRAALAEARRFVALSCVDADPEVQEEARNTLPMIDAALTTPKIEKAK